VLCGGFADAERAEKTRQDDEAEFIGDSYRKRRPSALSIIRSPLDAGRKEFIGGIE
jgi:hypothetical protein